MAESNSFDRLVSGLSSGERKDMLEKMKASTSITESLSSELIEDDPDDSISFSQQIKEESIFYRIYLWIKALLASTTMEAIYNERKISQIAKRIDKLSQGLMDYKRGLLLSSLYGKLMELKKCADFFRPYITVTENDDSAYLVFLGSLVMTDVERQMDEEVDPYSIPLTDGPKPEQRMSLLRKMDEIITQIPQGQRNMIYCSVQAAEWLKQFTKLPFQRLLSVFSTVIENNYSAAFSQIESEIGTFARVLCNGMKIPDEVLESLFLFYRRNSGAKIMDSIDEASGKAAEFMEKAGSQISMMRMFITTVPLKLIGRVVYADAQWMPNNFTGGEDWYQRYKANWRKLFDQKWEAWTHDCRKEVLRQNLNHHFGLDSFPLLPERPWAQLWGGIPFRYELTAGFLNWYMKDMFPGYEIVLKTVMLEGDFIQKENRSEYNDSFNRLIQVSIDLETMNRQMAGGGEYGIIFTKLQQDEKLRSLQANSKVESIIRGVEGDVRSILSSFGEACRTLELCFSGIFLEKKDSRYDSLSNFNRIGGKNNEKFKEDLTNARESLAACYSMIRELEPIDTPSLLK